MHADRIELSRRARLRTAGSDTTLDIPIAPAEHMRATSRELHQRRFGYVDESAEVIVDALVVEAIGELLPGSGRGTAEGGGGAHLRQLR